MECFAMYISRKILSLVKVWEKLERDIFLLITVGAWKIRLISSKIKRSCLEIRFPYTRKYLYIIYS